MVFERLVRRLMPLVVLLSIAGCGGGGHHATTASRSAVLARPVQPPVTVNGHPCDPADYVMQCALQGQPNAAPRTSQLGPQKTYADGIDFAWSCPNPASAKDFGISYFSPDLTKNWTVGCVNAWHAAHRATVGVYESSATRASQGYSAGRADALLAARQAAAVGNTNRPIFFAIDFDATGPDVLSYFQGAQSILGSRVRAYGGALPLDYLCGHGVVGNWVTYAWLYRTGGNWPSPTCAPLEQYLNTSTVDYDRALAPDYGQWPGPASKPPPDPYAVLIKKPFTINGVKASEYNTVKGWDALKCENPVRRQSCKATRYHLQLLAGRLWTVAHESPAGFPTPPTWNLFHRGARFQFLWSRVQSHHACWFVGQKFVCS